MTNIGGTTLTRMTYVTSRGTNFEARDRLALQACSTKG